MAFDISALFGMKTTADVYLTDLETGDNMQLSYVPEKISAQEKTSFQTYSVIERGEVKIPKGINLTSVSWSSILPGSEMMAYGFVKSSAWESPAEILKRWSKWKKEGTKLNLLITQTSINMRVYLSDFHYSNAGGLGNVDYSITFLAVRDLLIKTVKEMDSDNASDPQPLNEREEPPKPSTQTAKSDDTLWDIAEAMYGDGSRWTEIYENNRDILSDPDLIYPGQEIKLP